MTTVIVPVDSRKIEHGVLIDLTLIDPATNLPITYYISNCYKQITYNGQNYLALAGFLSVSEIQNNISNANDEVQLSLSAIPPEYIAATLGAQIKGGEVNIYRVFFDYNTQEVLLDGLGNQRVYKRFNGVISNYSVQEDITADGQSPEVTHSITIIASSILGVLENKVSGRRTNSEDYALYWAELNNTYNPLDKSMVRVDTLFNSSFDFGKKYTGQAASSVGSSTSMGTGSGNPSGNEFVGQIA
jgi:hypothetical protein